MGAQNAHSLRNLWKCISQSILLYQVDIYPSIHISTKNDGGIDAIMPGEIKESEQGYSKCTK